MLVEYTRYKIPREKQLEFERSYADASKALVDSPHCLRFELSHCEEDSENYILRIEWDSKEGHLNGFRASPEFQSFMKSVGPFYGNVQEMNHYEVTRVNGRKG